MEFYHYYNYLMFDYHLMVFYISEILHIHMHLVLSHDTSDYYYVLQISNTKLAIHLELNYFLLNYLYLFLIYLIVMDYHYYCCY